ncbi:hypothetical protein B0H10DRAFT_1187624 [Mycena sp. CBHHK59/15]|nr:hypothetical protein B0H10DRAFT_1187624 [Mycena sp. CBHHK59/15]
MHFGQPLRDSHLPKMDAQRSTAFFHLDRERSSGEGPKHAVLHLLAKAHEVMVHALRDNDVHNLSDDSADEHKAFGNSIKDWPVFPDTCGALRLLEKHYKLVILSNVDRESFSRTHIKLSQGTDLATYTLPVPNPNAQWLPKTTPNSASPFSLILTAQDTGVYKPDPRGMLAALGVIQEEFGIGKEQVLVVAQSLYHDVEPSSKLGVSSVWIDRQGATMGLETIDDAPKWRRRFETLGGMAKAVEEEKLQRDVQYTSIGPSG